MSWQVLKCSWCGEAVTLEGEAWVCGCGPPRVGDVVELKSGSPLLVVSGVEDGTAFVTRWDGGFCVSRVPLECLRKV